MSHQTPPAKKSLGQHWLDDEASLQAMCQAAEIGGDDIVLEIGPGPGALTRLLVRQAGQVVAVEFDEKLAAQLPERVPAANLQVVTQDILRFDLAGLPPDYKLVANIPYYLTSNLVRVISEAPNPPSLAVLLVQKEVAQRIAARPGEMSLLSATAQFYWHTELDRKVPAELFTPPPKVDSQIVILRRRTTPLFPEVEPKRFFQLVKAGFAQKRKTLLNSLGAGLHLSRGQTEKLLTQAGIEPTRRAQTLSLQEWHKLYENLD